MSFRRIVTNLIHNKDVSYIYEQAAFYKLVYKASSVYACLSVCLSANNNRCNTVIMAQYSVYESTKGCNGEKSLKHSP